MTETIFKKQTFLKMTGNPNYNLNKGVVKVDLHFLEASSLEELEEGNPNAKTVHKQYEMSIEEYSKNGEDDSWKFAVERDPQLAKHSK